MDAATLRHLDAWLERAFAEDVRDAARVRMLKLAYSDPEYWLERSWSDVARESGADSLR